MDRFSVEDSSTNGVASTNGVRRILQDGHWPIARHSLSTVPMDAKNQRIARLAQPRRIFRDSIQNWLHVIRRAGDHAQDFTRRGLPLQRLFEFLEQSHVL